MPAKQTTTTTPAGKGRPRTFDRSIALTRALEVFWQRGYEHATIAELCAAMKINPPSLYAAFGNKARLFMEAVQHYEDFYWNSTWDQMDRTPEVHQALSDFFLSAARILTTQEAPCGCLVVIAAMNLSPDAKDVTDALHALRQEGRDCFRARLKRAVEEGQLPESCDVEGLASTFNTVMEGMSVQARDGSSRDELERIARTAMGLLPPHP